jgi:hypothetical protein
MPCLQHQRITRADEFDANHPETGATVTFLFFIYFLKNSLTPRLLVLALFLIFGATT